MTEYVGNINVESLLTQNQLQLNFASNTLANSTLSLTSSSNGTQYFSGSTAGQILKLPNATTLPNGFQFTILNNGTQSIALQDNGGNALATISQATILTAILISNATSNGVWVLFTISATATGILNYNVVSSTNFATSANVDTLITGMTVTPQAGTYAIWFNAENTGSGSGQQLDCTVYNNGIAVADSKRSNLSTSGVHVFQSSTMTISQFSGSAACDIRVNANGNGMTIGQRSMLLIRLGP
jgi:hypothetical protein